MSTSTQLVIIGAGPGGYTAAFHAADLGLSVTLIDKAVNPGGVCLYRGCIPSKALLHAARVINEIKDAKNIGINCTDVAVDLDKLRTWKNSVVAKLTSGLGQLAKARKINYIQGEAVFTGATTISVKKADGITEEIVFEKAIIATGSRPVELPFLPTSARVLDATSILELPVVPSSLLVIGGGYIGLELGSACAALGASVSVVEALPQLLSGADKDLADILLRRLKKTFTRIMTSTTVAGAEETADGVRITFKDAQGQETAETYSHILVAVGRKPNTDSLGLEATGIELNEKGFIEVTAQRRTDEKNIYAIGDVTGNPMLAHKASAEAKVAASVIAGQNIDYSPGCVPSVIFTDPELAWCGITEQDALARGLEVTVSRFPWAASGRALTLDRTDGATKLVADSKTGRLLGVGIVGAGAGDLIAEGALAVETGLKAEELALTIHPHPTLSETLMEAAEGLFGQPTHLLRPKK